MTLFMQRVSILVFAVVLAMVATTFADDKKDPAKEKPAALSGKWAREVEGFDISFTFKPDVLTVVVENGGNGITCKCKYTVDKDGKVKATITEIEEKGEFAAKPKKGLEMSFKFKIDGKKATLEDFDAENAEAAKPIMEGEYESKAD